MSFIGNFSAASDKLNEIADALLENAKTVATDPTKINQYASNVAQYQASIPALIGEPVTLGTTLQDLFAELATLYSDPQDVTRVMSLFSDFGDNDIVINPTTAGLVERKKNNDILNTSVQAFALIQAYLSASQTEYTTVVEIEDAQDSLEESFQSIKTASGLGQ